MLLNEQSKASDQVAKEAQNLARQIATVSKAMGRAERLRQRRLPRRQKAWPSVGAGRKGMSEQARAARDMTIAIEEYFEGRRSDYAIQPESSGVCRRAVERIDGNSPGRDTKCRKRKIAVQQRRRPDGTRQTIGGTDEQQWSPETSQWKLIPGCAKENETSG